MLKLRRSTHPKTDRSRLQNEKGMAVFEMIPIIIIIILMMNFSLGFFGAIHTGILNSIACRNYAFETFRHRADLVYFRNVSNGDNSDYHLYGQRVHGTISENPSTGRNWWASTRTIDFFAFSNRPDIIENSTVGHSTKLNSLNEATRFDNTDGVNPIWIQTRYGICLTAACGS